MDNSERKQLWAKVNLHNVLIPVEQLYMFESCMQIEEKWVSKDDPNNKTNNKESYYETFIREVPKLPTVTLVSNDEVVTMQVRARMLGE
jgi:hypothetical protein